MKIFAIALMGFGVFLSFLNFKIAVQHFFLKKSKKSQSMIPIIGGAAAFFGAILYPEFQPKLVALIFLVFDIGCLPMLILLVVRYLSQKRNG